MASLHKCSTVSTVVLPLLDPLPALGVILHVRLACAREVDTHGGHHRVGGTRLALLQGTDVLLATLPVLVARVARESKRLEVGRHPVAIKIV